MLNKKSKKDMTKEGIKKRIQVCQMIAKDVRNDAKEFDGKPFNGKTMAEYMGNHGAAINTLAQILESILKEMTNE